MTDLVADLATVLDRVGQQVRAVPPGAWTWDGFTQGVYAGGTDPAGQWLAECGSAEIAELVATFSPDRVLALIAWTRDMLERHDWVKVKGAYLPYCLGCSGWPCRFVSDAARAWGVTP